MNLQVRGHLMSRKVKGIRFTEPKHFFIIFDPVEMFGLEYIDFDAQ